MGLDMYLNTNHYYGGKYKNDAEHTLKVSGKFVEETSITPSKIMEIKEEVCYWRKANQIHNWFVVNCYYNHNESSSSIYISKGMLRKLLSACLKTLVAYDRKDWNTVKELLPTQSGFFFGGTDYNEWYRDDIEHTIRMLEPVIDNPSYESFSYVASW